MRVQRRIGLVVLAVAGLASVGCDRLGGPYFKPRDASWTRLHDAALAGDLAAVEEALAAGAAVDEPTANRCTPLLLACRAGSLEVVGALLEAGAEADHTSKLNTSPVVAAAAYGHAHLLESLVEHGADLEPKKDLFTKLDPLHQAIAAGHLEVVREFVRLDPGAIEDRSRTAPGAAQLTILAKADSPEMLALLHDLGLPRAPPKVTAVDDQRGMMLHWFAFPLLTGDFAMAGAAIDAGVDPNLSVKDDDPGTILHAVSAPLKLPPNFREEPDLALDPVRARRRARGADLRKLPDLPRRWVEFLLAHGADPRLRDKEGRTPAEVAEEAGREALALALRMAAAARDGADRGRPAATHPAAPPESDDSR